MPFLAPLLANAGRAVASQGMGAATKQGLGAMAREGANKIGEKIQSGEAMESAMDKLKDRQQTKETERREKSSQLMEQGRQSASTGSATMGA